MKRLWAWLPLVVLGWGTADAAAQALGIEYELEKVTDIQDIMAAGVMMTPALVVDGEVKSSGKALSTDEIQAILG